MSKKPDTSAVKPKTTSSALWMDGIGTLNKQQVGFVYGVAFLTGGLIGLAFCHVDCTYQKFVFALAEVAGRPFGVFEPKEKKNKYGEPLTGAMEAGSEKLAGLSQSQSETQRTADIHLRRLLQNTQ